MAELRGSLQSSHIHMVIGRSNNAKMEDIIRDLKKYTAVKIIEAIRTNPQESRKELLLWLFEKAGNENSNNTRFQFWQQNNHPLELFTNEMLDQKIDYIHQNPVEAGIVLSPENYLYSSAVNYSGRLEKLIELAVL